MRQAALGFRLQAACLIELDFDAVAALVDAFEQEPVRPEIAEHADEKSRRRPRCDALRRSSRIEPMRGNAPRDINK
jgi:hypothetical protein